MTQHNRLILSVPFGDHLATFSALGLGACTFFRDNELMSILFNIGNI